MHLTILCSQFHYFASRSLKLKVKVCYSVVLSTVKSCLLLEGDNDNTNRISAFL